MINHPWDFFYDDLERAKEDIKKNLDSKEKKYIPIWNIIDKRWEDKLKGPLHRAGHYLNLTLFTKRRWRLKRPASLWMGLLRLCIDSTQKSTKLSTR